MILDLVSDRKNNVFDSTRSKCGLDSSSAAALYHPSNSSKDATNDATQTYQAHTFHLHSLESHLDLLSLVVFLPIHLDFSKFQLVCSSCNDEFSSCYFYHFPCSDS